VAKIRSKYPRSPPAIGITTDGQAAAEVSA
jgi:hypothetical protein